MPLRASPPESLRRGTKGASSGERVGQADDLDELVGLQARAADQGAVDLGLGDERAEVFGGDTAAVLHLQAFGDRWPTDVSNGATDQADGRVGVLGRRGAARADRPDRLVTNHPAPKGAPALRRAP